MSGKLIVGVLAALALSVLIYGLWFFGTGSPIDERFNFKRRPITSDTPQTRLLPDRVGDFLRRSLTPIAPTVANQLEGSAAYSDNDDKRIWLQVRSIAGERHGVSALDEAAGDTFKLHRDAPFPYGYGTTQDGYTFMWINGEWLFQAYTSEADAETLLQFVNGYPY